MGKSILKEKSYVFAISIVRLMKDVQQKEKEFVLSKQLLRSGTSVGTSIREAEYAQSGADFIHKLSISLKEANETSYWLSILKDTGYIEHAEYESLSKQCNEMIAMLVASVNTSKKNKNQ